MKLILFTVTLRCSVHSYAPSLEGRAVHPSILRGTAHEGCAVRLRMTPLGMHGVIP